MVDSGVKGATGTTARDVDATITEWPTEALPDLGALISLLGTSPECESARKIILTGIGDAPSLTTLLEKGQLDAVLTKPVAVSSLVASIRRTNDRSGLPMPAPSVASKCISTPLSGMRVLVVDDEPSVRLLLSDVLTDLGYAVIEAADSLTGLDVLRSEVRIDLLITDVGLPGGMNGRQMADAARQVRPGLKTFFITGYAENAVVGNGHLDPGMHVMTKPFAMEALGSRIRELIEAS